MDKTTEEPFWCLCRQTRILHSCIIDCTFDMLNSWTAVWKEHSVTASTTSGRTESGVFSSLFLVFSYLLASEGSDSTLLQRRLIHPILKEFKTLKKDAATVTFWLVTGALRSIPQTLSGSQRFLVPLLRLRIQWTLLLSRMLNAVGWQRGSSDCISEIFDSSFGLHINSAFDHNLITKWLWDSCLSNRWRS